MITYLQQVCADTGCSLADLPETMDDRDEWREERQGKSLLASELDDDDDIHTYIHTYIHEAYAMRTRNPNLGRRSPGGGRVLCREYVP